MYKSNKPGNLREDDIHYNIYEYEQEPLYPIGSIGFNKLINNKYMHYIHKKNIFKKNFRMD